MCQIKGAAQSRRRTDVGHVLLSRVFFPHFSFRFFPVLFFFRRAGIALGEWGLASPLLLPRFHVGEFVHFAPQAASITTARCRGAESETGFDRIAEMRKSVSSTRSTASRGWSLESLGKWSVSADGRAGDWHWRTAVTTTRESCSCNDARGDNKIVTSAAWHSRGCDSRAQCRPGRRQTKPTFDLAATVQHSTAEQHAQHKSGRWNRPFHPGLASRNMDGRKPQGGIPSATIHAIHARTGVVLRVAAVACAGDNPPNSSRRKRARDGQG